MDAALGDLASLNDEKTIHGLNGPARREHHVSYAASAPGFTPDECRRVLAVEVVMRRSVVLSCVLSLVSLSLPLAAAADGGSVSIEVDGLRSDRGEVRGALYASRDGWAEEGRQIATCAAPVRGHTATCVLEDVPPGQYAFAFLHDEDDDGQLDRNFIGIPDEGFGFSNDARPGLGAPSFESARFTHDGPATDLVVHARSRIERQCFGEARGRPRTEEQRM